MEPWEEWCERAVGVQGVCTCGCGCTSDVCATGVCMGVCKDGVGVSAGRAWGGW